MRWLDRLLVVPDQMLSLLVFEQYSSPTPTPQNDTTSPTKEQTAADIKENREFLDRAKDLVKQQLGELNNLYESVRDTL